MSIHPTYTIPDAYRDRNFHGAASEVVFQRLTDGVSVVELRASGSPGTLTCAATVRAVRLEDGLTLCTSAKWLDDWTPGMEIDKERLEAYLYAHSYVPLRRA